MNTKEENALPKIGYLYHYPQLDHPTDNFRLDIFISSVPTEEHFDVQHVHFFIKTPQETVEKITVLHPWNYKKTAHVCAGKVIMEDRNKEKKEAFTFGGELQIENQVAQTSCVLVSTAPILDLGDATPQQIFFTDELEILFAERRAMYPDHRAYEMQLSKADPLKLYLASLKALIQKFEDFPHKDRKYRQFLAFLHSEKHRLYAARISVDTAPSLDQIFQKKG